MLQREPRKLKSHSPFTGFIAHYTDGRVIKEREHFHSKVLNKNCATNWAEIDKSKLSKIEIVWKDDIKGYVSKEPTPDSFNTSPLQPQDWFFSQKGYFDLGSRKLVVVARNIGYIENGIANILSIVESSGIVQIYRRKV